MVFKCDPHQHAACCLVHSGDMVFKNVVAIPARVKKEHAFRFAVPGPPPLGYGGTVIRAAAHSVRGARLAVLAGLSLQR